VLRVGGVVIAHPIVLAVTVADTVAMILVAAAGVTAVRVLLGWSPGEASARQHALERRAEIASLSARTGVGLFALATVAALVAVASVLPGVVESAMCGTGVLQAMGGAGERALWLRALALLALGAWHLLDRLDRSSPGAPLATAAARALLAAAPIAVLAAVETARAFLGLDAEATVDCCGALYDAVRAGRSGAPGWAASVPWAWLAAGGGGALAAACLALARRAATRPVAPWLAGLVAALAWLWVLAAARALPGGLDDPGAPAHGCPWCLFSQGRWLVGYPLYALLAVVVAEGSAVPFATIVALRSPVAADAASRRARRALAATGVALIAFLALAVLAAASWRLRGGA
jgi:hypothetical protein